MVGRRSFLLRKFRKRFRRMEKNHSLNRETSRRVWKLRLSSLRATARQARVPPSRAAVLKDPGSLGGSAPKRGNSNHLAEEKQTQLLIRQKVDLPAQACCAYHLVARRARLSPERSKTANGNKSPQEDDRRHRR